MGGAVVSRNRTNACSIRFNGTSIPCCCANRATSPLSESIPVRRPRITSCAVDEVHAMHRNRQAPRGVDQIVGQLDADGARHCNCLLHQFADQSPDRGILDHLP
jgi:hypothetical protein